MKKYHLTLFSILLILGLTASANAWQIKLGDAYDVLEYYAYDITFSGDDSDNLSLLCLSVGYNTDDVSFTTVAYQDYDDGVFPVENDTWVGGGLPAVDDPDSGLVYSIMGEEPLGTSDVFYPVASNQTLLFTVFFEAADDGMVDDSSVYFLYGDDLNDLASDGIEVNGNYYVDHELAITADTITVSPVPIPAAVWLMGSGFFGLLGLRRRSV